MREWVCRRGSREGGDDGGETRVGEEASILQGKSAGLQSGKWDNARAHF